jgi:peptide/nickel transport system ATP-binding protein
LQVQFRTALGYVQAVDGVNLTINQGDSVGIVGESGSGKSVTALAILGLISIMGQVERGEIIFQGTDLSHIGQEKMRDIRGREITMIFQEPMTALNPVFTVGQQITDVIRLHTKVTKKEARERAEEVLKTVGLMDPKVLSRYPHELSGGMAQRIMIAMAISCHPTRLIADEPTTALDVTTQSLILEELRKLMKEFNLTLILITHDISIAAEICKTLVVMYNGEVVERGPLWDLLEKPAHPYTQGLLNAIPSLDRRELKTIEGTVPGPFERVLGCRFHPRCPFVMEKCKTIRPEMRKIAPDHYVSCHLYGDTGDG